ncbi:cob(I)yrinic acid a,c-diamide adenosyltransferase [Priestia koreensis]|uniref:cob(I)yrinic acid a,c-diamide adenosyltransferase n=1 Tax=Priestia koreensis TaxID=284581 RepID=UPI001F577AE7|nr:cob(I)yrinic acid a,c-diamide adenosyltransferase [Priestia koreensis]MCM3003693.1 cob(I)yrinic acid a,c-diamide adenosyltransferase [Priestia koreensis]UNL83807.1 cob(I)yrinic acid a,c-diamide adenosyltransferase [Priestia koreensis]
MKDKGRLLVYTGDGKGKTTAAMGLAIRAAGREKRVLIIQYIKSRTTGEQASLKKLGIDMHQTGIGFTWTKTPQEHRDALQKAWALTKDKIMSGGYDVVILDELNNALAIERFPIDDVLPLQEVLHLIKNRPEHMHLVITGRSAKQQLIDLADLVTEMNPIKHYYDEGVPAIVGIEK